MGKTLNIYSPETLTPLLLSTSGENGDFMPSIAFARPNRGCDIVVKYSLAGRVLPYVRRGYREADETITTLSKTFPIIFQNFSLYLNSISKLLKQSSIK